jgi:hypothetical protein
VEYQGRQKQPTLFKHQRFQILALILQQEFKDRSVQPVLLRWNIQDFIGLLVGLRRHQIGKLLSRNHGFTPENKSVRYFHQFYLTAGENDRG